MDRIIRNDVDEHTPFAEAATQKINYHVRQAFLVENGHLANSL
jgi:hypothetical protein